MRVPLAGPPLPDPRPYLRLWTVKPGPSTEFLALTDRVLDFNVHYVNSRTLPCFHPSAYCEHCVKGSPTRWAGYLSVLPRHGRTPYALMIGASAYTSSPSLKASEGRLRGKQLTCTRLGKTNNAPLQVIVSEPNIRFVGGWQEIAVDLPASLARWWGIDTLELVAPPLTFPVAQQELEEVEA